MWGFLKKRIKQGDIMAVVRNPKLHNYYIAPENEPKLDVKDFVIYKPATKVEKKEIVIDMAKPAEPKAEFVAPEAITKKEFITEFIAAKMVEETVKEKVEDKIEDKPNEKPEEKPEEKIEEKPAEKHDEKRGWKGRPKKNY